MRWLMFSAFVALTALSALNWRAQLQTQQKLDALTAALAERPAAPEPTPVTPPAPTSDPKPIKPVPHELQKITLPPYVIEAPDQLLVEARLPVQPVSGSFLVRPDGTVGLGYWGSVPVAGLTLEQAAGAIRTHLAGREPFKQLDLKPESLAVTVDVTAYNSKKYYVITDDEVGEKVFAFPITGSECVLDALSETKGLPDINGRRKVWVARRSAKSGEPWQVLPVDWAAITRQGVTSTNYQLMPGDRVYVKRAAD